MNKYRLVMTGASIDRLRERAPAVGRIDTIFEADDDDAAKSIAAIAQKSLNEAKSDITLNVQRLESAEQWVDVT